MTNEWELNYKLALLRAAGVDVSRIANIDIDSVDFTITGYDEWQSGCETCGGSSAEIDVYLQWIENNKMKNFYVSGEALVADFVRRVLAP
jgi:hypothetical protein